MDRCFSGSQNTKKSIKSFNKEIVNNYCVSGPETEIGCILVNKTNRDNFWSFFRLNTQLPFDFATPFLSICP